jgi:hypothetical protein
VIKKLRILDKRGLLKSPGNQLSRLNGA